MVDAKMLREATRALLLGAGAAYLASAAPTEAKACAFCATSVHSPNDSWCSWQSRGPNEGSSYCTFSESPLGKYICRGQGFCTSK